MNLYNRLLLLSVRKSVGCHTCPEVGNHMQLLWKNNLSPVHQIALVADCLEAATGRVKRAQVAAHGLGLRVNNHYLLN